MSLYRQFTSQEQIEEEYDLASKEPNLAAIMDDWIEESETTRDDLDCELDLAFGPTLDETLDVFPAENPDSPILIFIHGGYWRMLTSKEFSFIARGFNTAGFSTVVTNYSLCPKVTITEITRQSRAAVSWVYNNARQINGDENNIFVCGHSAGGHQAAMVAITNWWQDYGLPEDTIKGAIPVSGVFDLEPLRYFRLQPTLMITHELIKQQSPIHNIPERAPPVFATVGEYETGEFKRQCSDFISAWRDAGLTGHDTVQNGDTHFTILDGFKSPDSRIMEEVMAFIKSCH